MFVFVLRPPIFTLFPYTTLFRSAIPMDARVFVFVFAISLLTGLLFGLLPAWSGTRGDIAEALRENARTTATGVSRSRSEEHTSELQSRRDLVCRLLLEKKKYITK